MRILIVEDAEMMRKSLVMGLKEVGYNVDAVSDGEQGLCRAIKFYYDIILLDVLLPGMDGNMLLQRLREVNTDVMVLMLTAKDTVKDRINGLRDGADDYLVKPFSFSELLVRIRCLLNRRNRAKNSIACHVVRHISLDLNTKTVKADDTSLELPPREYTLLEYLLLNRNKVVSREELVSCLYSDDAHPTSNAVNSVVSALRKKIDKPELPSIIETRHGFGYKIAEQ